jgi:gentisate 1,2-dioxygenase
VDLKKIQDNMVFNDKTFTKRILFVTPEVLCFILNLKVGQTLPVHKHENSGLIYHVLSGCGEIKINDDVSEISNGTVGFVKGQDDFSIPTVKDDLSLFVSISPNPSNELYSKGLG